MTVVAQRVGRAAVAIAKVLLPRSHSCYSLRVALRVDWDEGAREELRRLPAAESSRPFLEEAQLQLNRIETATTQLLRYARPPELRQVVVDGNLLVERAVRVVAAQAARHNVVVRSEPCAEPVTVRVDSELMVQVLVNLMLNGIEAMERGELTACYIIGENPVRSEADTGRTSKLLGGLDHLVVQDIFLTDTAALADVLVEGEKIVAVLDPSFTPTVTADEVIDAGGKYVIPGGIDAHTHMELPFGGTFAKDTFETGTRAAAFGGTTTIIDFAVQSKGKSLREGLDAWHAKAEGKACVDYGFHMIMSDVTEASLAEMDTLVAEGVTDFKLFTAYPGVFYSDDGAIFRAMQRAAANGGAIMMPARNRVAHGAYHAAVVAGGDAGRLGHAVAFANLHAEALLEWSPDMRRTAAAPGDAHAVLAVQRIRWLLQQNLQDAAEEMDVCRGALAHLRPEAAGAEARHHRQHCPP